MITPPLSKRDDSVTTQRTKLHSARVPERVQWALAELLNSLELAEDVEHSCWDFAVEATTLREAGLCNSELRWLVCKAFVAHARETTGLTADQRTFEETGLLNLTSETCFVLTSAGEELARSLRENTASELTKVVDHFDPAQDSADAKPVWDVDRYELWWQGKLVKRYSVPSPNQRTVLAAFEEEGWPRRVDDPLPQHPELDPKRRLHDTIKSLNRHQQHPLLRFHGDGTGEGVRWEPV